MNLMADPMFVKAEMAYRREQALGMVGHRTGPGALRRLLRRTGHGPASGRVSGRASRARRAVTSAVPEHQEC
jgi:hypothetical protein